MVGDIILIAPTMRDMVCPSDETHYPRSLLVPHYSDHEAGFRHWWRGSTHRLPPDYLDSTARAMMQFT